MNIRTHDLYEFFDTGQRAFRLKKSIKDCPKFEQEIYCKAWKSGYRMSGQRFGLNDGFKQFLKKLDNEYQSPNI
jgi:hypothetical protein